MLGSTEARAQPAFRMAHQGLIVAAVHVAGVLVLGAVLAAAAIADRPVADFTREPVRAMLRTSCDGATCSAIGFLSTLGLLAWIVCATVCFVVAWAERDRPRGTSLRPVFVSAGLLTLALALDDGFALHESLAYLTSPYAEELIFALYGIAAGGLVLVFRSFVARTSYWLLLAAAALLVSRSPSTATRPEACSPRMAPSGSARSVGRATS